MKKEYDFKKLKKVTRPAWSKKKLKVVKTIRLDLDVVGWLVAESERRGLAYQTLINSLLKEAMNRSDGDRLRQEIREIVREELQRKVS